MNFQQKLAHIVIGHNSNSDLIKAAEIGLEEGLESISLAITAGLFENENSLVVNEYFQKSLKELNIELPDEEDAVVMLIRYFANKTLSHELGIFEGLQAIWDVVCCDVHSTLYNDFAGFYYQHDELISGEIRAEDEETQQLWIRESEKAIIAELQNWKEKYKI